MTETLKTTATLLADWGDGQAAHYSSRERVRDIIKSFDVQREATLNVLDAGYAVDRNGVVDATSALLAAMAAGANRNAPILFPDGIYKISDELVVQDHNQSIILSPGTKIVQTAPNKHTIKAVQKDNFRIRGNGGLLFGEGSWSAAWNDFASHNDRGIGLYGCTNSGFSDVRFQNHAMAAFAILGGTNIWAIHPSCEGTHALGHPLTPGTSIYQFGGVVMHDVTYGAYKGVHIISPTLFNLAMGLNSVMNTPSDGQLTISDLIGHTFFAQHCLYLGTSNTQVDNPNISDCSLDGIKVYSGAINEVIENVVISDFVISTCGGQAVELGVSGTGSISASSVSGTATDCARALVLDGNIRGVKAKITSERMSQYDLLIQGATGPTDCDIEVTGRNATLDSVNIASATSDRNRIRPKIYRPSRGGGSNRGVYVNACAGLTLESLEATDDDSKMAFGCFVDTNGHGVIFTGTPKIFGYITNAIQVSGDAKWQASPGEFTSLQTAFLGAGNHVEPVSVLRIGRQTTSNANVPIWQYTLPDNSSWQITARLVGELAGSTEQRAVTFIGLFKRVAGGAATQVGATTVTSDIVSGGFAGTYSFSPTVNDARIIVNSTLAATYNWRAEITALKMSP